MKQLAVSNQPRDGMMHEMKTFETQGNVGNERILVFIYMIPPFTPVLPFHGFSDPTLAA